MGSSPYNFEDMSSSFLNEFRYSSDYEEEEEEESRYDALNEETFGELTLENGDDWEAEHERYANSEQSRKSTSSQNDETNELSTQIASAVLNDDDPNTTSTSCQEKTKTLTNSFASKFFGNLKFKNDSGFVNLPLNISYVQDIERNIREGMTTPVPNSFNDDINHQHTIPKARRAEDIERELTHSVPVPPPLPPPPVPLLGILPTPGQPRHIMQPSGHLPANVNQVPLVGVPPGPLNFLNSNHQNQPQGQPMAIINPMYGQNISVPIMPHGQTIGRPPLAHNGIPGRPVPLPPGLAPSNGPLPAGMQGIVNQQFNYPHPHQSSQMFYSSNQRQMKLGVHHMHPPQLPNQNYNYQKNNWRRNPHPSDMTAVDEYAGLMTDPEKAWLGQIQLLQLNNLHPYKDDYYFTMHQNRRQGNSIRNIRSGSTSSNVSRDGHSSKTTYMPQQFENSLGKLQVGSVTAPRKIIDTDVVDCIENNGTDVTHCSDVSGASASCSGFSKAPGSSTVSAKTKVILLELEMMYQAFLKAEDYLNPQSGISPDGEDPLQIMTSIAQCYIKDQKMISYLGTAKGRKLLNRVLPYLSKEVQTNVLNGVVLNHTLISRKDGEQILFQTLPAIRKFISNADLDVLNRVFEGNITNLSYIMTSIFCISIIANMFARVEGIMARSGCADDDSIKWLKFVKMFILAVPKGGPIARPVVGLDANTLRNHLQRSINLDHESDDDLKEKIDEIVKALSNSNGNGRPD